jgi:hypothetical protein
MPTKTRNHCAAVAAVASSILAVAGCGRAAVTASPRAPASVASSEAGTGDFHYQASLGRGRSVEVRAVSGAIVAEPATDGVLRIEATKQVEDGGTPDDVRFVAVRNDDGLLVCALYRGQTDEDCRPGRHDDDEDSQDEGGGPKDDIRVRTEFTLRVPAGLRLVARTMNGPISVDRVRGDVRLATMNGGIRVSTTGAVEAQTMNGAIDAVVAPGPGPFVFETMNGDVSVTLPGSMEADVHASTMRGDIDSDFPLNESSDYGPSVATGRIGGGGARLEASTMNGDVGLRRIAAPSQPCRPEED